MKRGKFGSSDRNPMVEIKKRLRLSNKENRDVLGTFGDDPDPTVTTARVGFGTSSDVHSRGSMHYAKRG